MVENFEGSIYGSSKGYIRLNVLWADLLSEIPELQRGGLRILDAGGGTGHMALRVANLGNEVVLCDPSSEMLDKAEKTIREADLSELVETLHTPIQELDRIVEGKFDLITCHAVLEWLASPEETLKHLATFLKTEGHLSLMFYNRNAALMKRILAGDFDTALREYQRTSPERGVDKATPLAEDTVRGWLERTGITVTSKSGIRIFHDHLSRTVEGEEQLESLLELEKALRKQEPFSSMAQHIHLVCKHSIRAGQSTSLQA